MSGPKALRRKRNIGLKVQPGAARDVPAILGLIRGLARYEHLAHTLKTTARRLRRDGFGAHPYFRTLLCRNDGKIIGFALYFFTYSTFLSRPNLYIEDLFVKPGHRGAGAGKALMSNLARVALRMGCGRMEWTVLNWNRPAISFYERIGASLHKEWLLTRLTGTPLRRLAKKG
jgi:GNAT superfamily N-acetyltransferase